MTRDGAKFWWIMGALFFLAGAVYAVAFGFLSGHPVGRDIMAAFGDALLVASVLSFTVDRYVKLRLASEVARDVLSYAVGFEVPKEIQQAMKNMIQMPFVRRNFKMLVKLEALGADGQYVTVITKVSYSVENLAGRTRQYDFLSRIETSRYPLKGRSDIRSLGVTKLGDKNAEFSYRGSALESKLDRGQTFVQFKQPVLIPGKPQVNPEFWTERSTVMKSSDTYLLDFLEPTIGVTIEADAPDDFDVTFLAPDGRHIEEFPPNRPTSWYDGGVYLPGQHLRIAWSAQTTMATQPASASTLAGR